MTQITIYVKDNCPFCHRAQDLLRRKGVNFDIINAGNDANLRDEMIKKSNGRTTFPQIFIGTRHIGGCDDLYAFDETGQLDPLLSGDVS